MSTPIDIDRLKIKIKLGRSVLGQRSWSAELYLDDTDSPPITEYDAIQSERYADPESHTEEAGFTLATTYLCNGSYAQYIWSVPSQCSDRTWRAKDKITVVIPPKPTPFPTPEPTPTPSGSVQSVTELPAVSDPVLVARQEESREQITKAETTLTEQQKKAEQIKQLKAGLKRAGASLVASLAKQQLAAAVGRSIRGNSAAAGLLRNVAGASAIVAVESIFAKVSASRANAAELREITSTSIDDTQIADTVDLNISQSFDFDAIQEPEIDIPDFTG